MGQRFENFSFFKDEMQCRHMLLALWVVPDPQGSHRVCVNVGTRA